VSASSATDAWAVGFTQEAGGHSLGLTRHWDGSRWRTVDSVHPMDYSFVWGVADISPSDAWAVGEGLGGAMMLPFIEHWDGTSWRQKHFHGPGIGKLTAVSASGPDDVWMIGTRNDTNPFQYPRAMVVHWDGQSLRIVHHIARFDKRRSVELTSVSAVSPDDVWIAGNHGGHGQAYLPFTEHFDGTSWTIVNGDPAQGTNADLAAIDADAANDAWSVGWYVPAGESTIAAYAQHWDGTSWTQSPVPTLGYGSYLTGVSVVAPDDVWAVGTWTKRIFIGTSKPFVLHWDGKSWAIVDAPHGTNGASFVESVSMDSSSDGFAVGETTSDTRAWPYVIHWDGTAWTR
jgi:hypothetical protein